ncbi:hypothetical protein, partial [Mesorhizobium sp. M5C.F.Ca.IN.020.32.2.1]|uniref:hypothetical protein n=1 Tax=Mesorhizobium sp. M5C.F.Ca.IN.020.32.2.1 TaxID=2496771 RepID=UPI0019D4314D
ACNAALAADRFIGTAGKCRAPARSLFALRPDFALISKGTKLADSHWRTGMTKKSNWNHPAFCGLFGGSL